ncbi:MAG: translation initiation factor IF-3 [Candidatus Pacebacteria bacterium]|nr:translation initiation factor IF-3 [Candidatus Paceibacterota bacterium]
MNKFTRKRFYRLNQSIQAEKVRVIDEKGKQIGILSLAEALVEARNQGLDLVEIAPKGNPPVCKIIDFKKLKYQEKKKNASQKRRKSEIKEIRLRPFIGANDLNVRLERAKKFLKNKNQVRVRIVFRGREIAKKELGQQLLATIVESLAEFAQVSQATKAIGKQLIMTLSPYEKKASQDQAENQKLS